MGSRTKNRNANAQRVAKIVMRLADGEKVHEDTIKFAALQLRVRGHRCFSCRTGGHTRAEGASR